MKPIATFSIVAFDPQRREWGVAVQSKFLAVGSAVPGAKAEVGAVATQSYANLCYVPDGLALMEQGYSSEEAIARLVEADEHRDLRQVGMVDLNGTAAAFTGKGCHEWAGHQLGQGYACQGNILVPGTVEAMAAEFEKQRSGPGELADWLVAALAAGQAAGGDKRGRQSAAMLVVRKDGGYGGNNDRYLDLRIDDHPTPIAELKRILQIHHLFFGESDPDDRLPLNEVAEELQTIMKKAGFYDGPVNGQFDLNSRRAMTQLAGVENLEERWSEDDEAIDRPVMVFLRNKFKS
jgi:uncharacterized Ntn-hydrolase superfamily protein